MFEILIKLQCFFVKSNTDILTLNSILTLNWCNVKIKFLALIQISSKNWYRPKKQVFYFPNGAKIDECFGARYWRGLMKNGGGVRYETGILKPQKNLFIS